MNTYIGSQRIRYRSRAGRAESRVHSLNQNRASLILLNSRSKYLLILPMELLRVCCAGKFYKLATSSHRAAQPGRGLHSSDRDNIHGDHQASVDEGALWYLPRLLCRYNILQRVRDETHLFHILSAISSTQLQWQEIKTSQV